jgi:hypothetical protein
MPVFWVTTPQAQDLPTSSYDVKIHEITVDTKGSTPHPATTFPPASIITSLLLSI